MTANDEYGAYIRQQSYAITGGIRLNSTAIQERLTTAVVLNDTRQWLAFLVPGAPNASADQSNANWNSLSLWFSLSDKPDFTIIAKTIFSSVRSGGGSLLSQGYLEHVNNQLHVRYQTNAGSGFADHYYDVDILPDTLYHIVVAQQPFGVQQLYLNGQRLTPTVTIGNGGSFADLGLFNGPLTLGCRHLNVRQYSFYTDITVYSVEVYPAQVVQAAIPYLYNHGLGIRYANKHLITNQNNTSTAIRYLPSNIHQFRPQDLNAGTGAGLNPQQYFMPVLGNQPLYLHQSSAITPVYARRCGQTFQPLPIWS